MGSAADEYSRGNLVVYREKIAIVTASGSKIAIRLANGTTVNVRPKDIALLHEGPVSDFSQLQPPEEVDFNELREVLEGETTTVGDLAELAYGENTPAGAQAIYALIQDGLYCTGSIAALHVNTLKEYESELNRRKKRVAEQQAWDSFIERVRQKSILESDHDKLRNLEAVAYGKSSGSRILKELNSETTPENAHQLLLDLGHWDFHSNPYIKRFGFSADVTCPDVPIDLPEENRLDLTHLKAFAIDDEGNTDPDDAISYDNGKIWIHIADVAAVVHPDSTLDIHARSQAATLYLPEKTVTMLPHEITDMFGLGLSETSPALSFGLTLNDNGEIDTIEIHPTIIKVTRITYTQAEKMLDQSPIKEMYDLVLKYHKYRVGNGAIQLDFPEVKIRVKNNIVQITPLPDVQSQKLVSNAMLMAGEAAARFALKNNIPFLFTTQPAPDYSEIPEAIRTPKTLSDMFAFRRYLKPGQIKYSAESHAGLGLAAYSRATSPMRRYVDLIAHQQLRAFIQDKPVMDEQRIINRIGAAEAIIGNVTKIERLSNRHWTLVYLMHHPDWSGKGIVVDKRDRFSIVLIPELGLESRITVNENIVPDSEVVLSVKSVDLVKQNVYFNVN